MLFSNNCENFEFKKKNFIMFKFIGYFIFIYYLDFSFFNDPKTKELEPTHWEFVNNLILRNEIEAKHYRKHVSAKRSASYVLT